MTVSFDTKVYLKGGRQYAHIKCSTSNNTVERIVRCPRPVVNPSTFGGNVNSESTANQACAINSRTGGKGGSRPKISKNMHIYRVFLSFNKDEISDLISRLGVAKSSFYITRAVGTRLKGILNQVFNETLAEAIQETIETIEEITEELEEIAEAASEREQIFNTIESTRVCLNQTNDFKIVYDYSNNDYKMVLNNLSEFEEYKRYGLYGTSVDHEYVITNIPFNHYIAVLNQNTNINGQDISNFITYNGRSGSIPRYKVVPIEGVDPKNWKTYTFYTDEITITVKSNFMYNTQGFNFIDGGISLYHFELGYMGMENALIYTTDCAGVVGAKIPEPESECLDMSRVVITNDTRYGEPVYLFNGENRLYSYLNTGTYIFTDISALTPMNIIIDNSSSGLLFSGNDSSNSSITDVDGNKYYYDQTVLTVSGEFSSTDLKMILYDSVNDISYIQTALYFNNTCTIELVGIIENITVQLFMELTNLENGIEEVSEDVSAYQLLVIKLNLLIKILNIVNKLVSYVIKYYTQNGILDLSGTINEERTGSNVNLATKAINIRTNIQSTIDSIQTKIDDVLDDEEVQNFLANASDAAGSSKADVQDIQNANKQFVTAAASATTDLNFQLDPFNDNSSLITTPPDFSAGITRWFATDDTGSVTDYKGNILLLELLSDGLFNNINGNLSPTYVIPSDISLVYANDGNDTSDINATFNNTTISRYNDYIEIPSGEDISMNCSTSGYYYTNMSYELWVKSTINTDNTYSIIEDLSRSIDISLIDTYQHIVKTFSISYDDPPISIETLYKNGVFDSSFINYNYQINQPTLPHYLFINGNDVSINFTKFNIYNHVLNDHDVSFLSLQDNSSSSLNYKYTTFSNYNFYKFDSCIINEEDKVELLPNNTNYNDPTSLLLGRELWDETIGEIFPFLGAQTTLQGSYLDSLNLKFEMIIISIGNGQTIDFSNVLTASQLLNDYSSNIVDYSNFKKYIPDGEYIDKIYLNNLNTEEINRPVITLTEKMKYVKRMLTNWGIASNYIASETEDKYIAMYSIYI